MNETCFDLLIWFGCGFLALAEGYLIHKISPGRSLPAPLSETVGDCAIVVFLGPIVAFVLTFGLIMACIFTVFGLIGCAIDAYDDRRQARISAASPDKLSLEARPQERSALAGKIPVPEQRQNATTGSSAGGYKSDFYN